MAEACGILDMWHIGTQSYRRKCLCSQIHPQLIHQVPIFGQHQHYHYRLSRMPRLELALVPYTPQHKTKTGSDLFHEAMTYKYVLDQD